MKNLILSLFVTTAAYSTTFASSPQIDSTKKSTSNVEIYVEVIKKQFNCIGECFSGKVFKLKTTPDRVLRVDFKNISCVVSVSDLTVNIASIYAELLVDGKGIASIQSTLNPYKKNVMEEFDELLLKGSEDAVCAVSLRTK